MIFSAASCLLFCACTGSKPNHEKSTTFAFSSSKLSQSLSSHESSSNDFLLPSNIFYITISLLDFLSRQFFPASLRVPHKIFSHKSVVLQNQITNSCPFSLIKIMTKLHFLQDMGRNMLQRLIVEQSCYLDMLKPHFVILSKRTH